VGKVIAPTTNVGNPVPGDTILMTDVGGPVSKNVVSTIGDSF